MAAGEVGIVVTKGQLDNQVGQLCLQTKNVISNWATILAVLDQLTDEQITALGYDEAGLAKVRAIATRAGELTAALVGEGTITEAHDYRIELAEWWGLGLG